MPVEAGEITYVAAAIALVAFVARGLIDIVKILIKQNEGETQEERELRESKESVSKVEKLLKEFASKQSDLGGPFAEVMKQLAEMDKRISLVEAEQKRREQ